MDAKWTDAGKVLALKSDFKAVGLNNVGSGAPSNPEEGEPWYDSVNHFIRWYDGSGWNAICVYIGTAAPGTPVEGLLWYDTDTNLLKSYDGSAWVTYALHIGTSAPGAPTEGHLWYDTTNHYFKGYDGSAWTSFSTIVGTASPGTPVEGLLWYDSDSNLLRSYDGGTWNVHPVSGNIGPYIENSAIDRAKLKTDTEEETVDAISGTVYNFVFSSVGEYGFYPNIKFEASTTGINIIIYNIAGAGPTDYSTTIHMQHTSGANRNIYAQIRYVTASGEIYWVFILQDKLTKKYIRMHGCPDHPAISCHDVEAVHHPFHDNYDPKKHNMFCIPLTKTERAEVEDMREWKNELPGLSFLETVKKYYDIDENPKGAKWPAIPVTIGLDRKRKPMKAKIPKRDYIKQAALIKKV